MPSSANWHYERNRAIIAVIMEIASYYPINITPLWEVGWLFFTETKQDPTLCANISDEQMSVAYFLGRVESNESVCLIRIFPAAIEF